MITSSIPMDERRLTRYVDLAIREFNRTVGICPGVIAIQEKHGYYAFLWKLAQQDRFAIVYKERTYENLDMYLTHSMKDNEIWLFLYYHPMYMWGFKYVMENERVHRVTELKDGYRMPRWTIKGTLEKVKLYSC